MEGISSRMGRCELVHPISHSRAAAPILVSDPRQRAAGHRLRTALFSPMALEIERPLHLLRLRPSLQFGGLSGMWCRRSHKPARRVNGRAIMTYVRWMLTLIALLLSVIAYRMIFPGPIPPTVPATDPVEGMLDCRLPQFKVENMRVDDAVALLAKQTHIPFHVDWADVEVHVKFKDRRISLDLHDVPIWAVLKTIFGADWTNQG